MTRRLFVRVSQLDQSTAIIGIDSHLSGLDESAFAAVLVEISQDAFIYDNAKGTAEVREFQLTRGNGIVAGARARILGYRLVGGERSSGHLMALVEYLSD
jgi:hypothetical protein